MMISQSLWLLVANPKVGSNKPESPSPTGIHWVSTPSQGSYPFLASIKASDPGSCGSKDIGKISIILPKENGDFLKRGYPKMDGFSWKIPLTWMILGYHHFRKPPIRDGKFKKTTETSLKHAGHAEHCRQSCRVASRWITFPQTWSCKKQLCSSNGGPWDLKPWSLVFGCVELGWLDVIGILNMLGKGCLQWSFKPGASGSDQIIYFQLIGSLAHSALSSMFFSRYLLYI